MSNSNTPLPDLEAPWDKRNPKISRSAFLEALPGAKSEAPKEYLAILLTQLARTYSLEYDFPPAHQYLDEAESLLEKNMALGKIRYWLERGRTYNVSNEKEKAKALFLKAFDLALEKNYEYYAVDAAHMMGIVEPPEQQIQWSKRAMAIAEQSEEQRTRDWLGPLYNNTGWSYHDTGDYKNAFKIFEKSLSFRTEKQDLAGISIARWCLGRTHRSLGEPDKALEIHFILEKEIQKTAPFYEGYVYEEIAECLFLKQETDRAKIYFKKAHKILKENKWLKENEHERLDRLKKLSI